MTEPTGLPPFNIPIPDPSVITAQEIAKARIELRREFEVMLKGLSDTLVATREGYVRFFESQLEGTVTQINEKIAAVNVKFEGINQRLMERDRRFDGALDAYKDAATAQMVATSSALIKSEASFTKEIDSLKTLSNAKVEGLLADMGNLKGRIDRGEGGTQGARSQIEEHRANTTLNTTIISGVVGFLVLIIAFAGLWMSTRASHS